MNKNFIAYILPVITLLGIVIFAFLNPNITGFAVGGDQEAKDVVNATIKIFTSQGVVLPRDATVIVYLDDKSAFMSVDKFISLSNSRYDYKNGRLPQIDYDGPGYTGNYNYYLAISEFGLGEVAFRPTHDLRVIVMYGGKVISESSQKVKRS